MCRAYLYAVAQACDRQEVTRKDAAGVILQCAEKATWMAGEAIQASAATGTSMNTPPAASGATPFLRDRRWDQRDSPHAGSGASSITRQIARFAGERRTNDDAFGATTQRFADRFAQSKTPETPNTLIARNVGMNTSRCTPLRPSPAAGVVLRPRSAHCAQCSERFAPTTVRQQPRLGRRCVA